ncbi:PilZ domain-containing protein [Sphingomonas sp. F9_3S_D5_B_2]|jgi:hypothetical protein
MSDFGKCRGGGRRRARREPAPALAVFTTVTRSFSAVVVDLSCTGVRLRSPDLPEMGEELIVTVENARAFGSVAWILGDEFGVAFDDPISLGEVQMVKHRLKKSAGLAPELSAALEDWTTGMAR